MEIAPAYCYKERFDYYVFVARPLTLETARKRLLRRLRIVLKKFWRVPVLKFLQRLALAFPYICL